MDDTVELSLDSASDYEIADYRTTFDANGYPERETPAPQTALSTNTKLADSEGTLRLLWDRMQRQDDTIKSLEQSNATLQSQFELERLRLKQILGAAVLFTVCGAAGLLWSNHRTGQRVDASADRLLLSIGDGEKQAQQANSIALETRTRLDKTDRRIADGLQAQASQLQAVSLATNEDQAALGEVRAAVDSARADVELGHQQLSQRHNPQQAILYARRAIDRLDAFQAKSDSSKTETKTATGTLSPAYQSAWALAAQSALLLGEIDAVSEYGNRLIDSDPQGPAGYEYEGIAILYRTLGGDRSDASRSKLRLTAKEKLQAAVRHGEQGNQALLLLAAAHFDDQEFRLAADRAQQFLQSYPQSTSEPLRLSPRIKAAVALAKTWRELAEAAVGRDVTLDAAQQACDAAAGERDLVESRIHEEILNGIAQSPEQFGFTGQRAQDVAEYCGVIAEALRTSQCPEPVTQTTQLARTANYACTDPDCRTSGRRLVVNNYTNEVQSFIVNGVLQQLAHGQHVFQIANRDSVVAHLATEPKQTWTNWQKRKDGNGLELVVGIDDSLPQRK